ncbi:MAG: acetamidase/formamidase family protein [Betaproteobacteria bacterium]|nr:acetamidase/formamidase family protein [Betaproteobacteria bacterium]
MAASRVNPPGYPPDATLRSTPETVVWGYIRADRAPVLRIRSGQTVRIDTVTHQGLNTQDDPVTYFGAAGITPAQVLQDARDIYPTLKREEGAGAHIITGPIYIEGAQAGDMLEIRVLDVEFRVPYGVNATGPDRGAVPDLLQQSAAKVIKLDLERRVALFSADVEVPLAPFMGIVAVAPPPEVVRVSTKPPGAFGGNIDFKHLTAGSTLYLPVFNEGALFYTGDGHAVQGDGEVDGTAIEISLTPTLQLIVHKGAGRNMKWPRAEDAAHYYSMGMGADLDEALKNAIREAVGFLQHKADLSPAEAYALCSLAVDFSIGEAVNNVLMVYGAIPKKLFKEEEKMMSVRGRQDG